MPTDLLSTIIDSSGVVAVVGILVWYIDRQEKRTSTLVGNHLQHTSESLNEVSKNMVKMATVLDRMDRKNK